MSMKGNYNEAPFTDSKKSAPNYFESKYQLKQAASPLLSPSLRVHDFLRQTRPKVGWDEDQQPFESPSDGSNMALMLIRQFFFCFWPAPPLILTQPGLWLECAAVAAKAKGKRRLCRCCHCCCCCSGLNCFYLISTLDGKQTFLWPRCKKKKKKKWKRCTYFTPLPPSLTPSRNSRKNVDFSGEFSTADVQIFGHDASSEKHVLHNIGRSRAGAGPGVS